MARPRSNAQANVDMTPFLGLNFLLMAFFMVVTNFRAKALDLNLRLPVVGSARPVDTKGQVELLILNIDKQGTLRIYGVPKVVEDYIASEARVSMITARKTPGWQEGDELPVTVVIRADRETPFRALNRVITACQQNKFYKFALKATDRERER